jgi:hypothetical protein
MDDGKVRSRAPHPARASRAALRPAAGPGARGRTGARPAHGDPGLPGRNVPRGGPPGPSEPRRNCAARRLGAAPRAGAPEQHLPEPRDPRDRRASGPARDREQQLPRPRARRVRPGRRPDLDRGRAPVVTRGGPRSADGFLPLGRLRRALAHRARSKPLEALRLARGRGRQGGADPRVARSGALRAPALRHGMVPRRRPRSPPGWPRRAGSLASAPRPGASARGARAAPRSQRRP